MKTSTLAFLLSLLPAAIAADSAAASPTESYGCEPHGDHYHCEGLRATLSTSVTEAVAATTTEVHDHDDDEDEDEDHDHSSGTASAGASPTESWGCEPHGDHYHCSGSRATLTTDISSAAAAAATTAAETETHDHDEDETGTASAAASPTESYGCEPHGDHWHCDGARTATEGESTPTANATHTGESTAATTDNAGVLDVVPVLGLFAAVVFAL